MLSELDRQLLSELCLLESFTAEQASSISNQADVATRISKLASTGKYLIKENKNEFSIEQDLRSDLRTELAQNKDSFKAQAHFCANVMFESGAALQSVELYNLAGEKEKAAEIAMHLMPQIVYRADIEMLNKWSPAIAKLIGEGKDMERIFTVFGYIALGKNEQAKALVRELSGLKENSKFVSFELQVLKQMLNFLYGNFEELHDETRALLSFPHIEFAGHPHSKLSSVRPALIACMLTMNRKCFYEIYDQIEPELTKVDNENMRIRINSVRAMKSFMDGIYIAANEYALAALELAEELQTKGSFMPFEAAYIAADTALEFGLEELSENYASEYLDYAIKYNQYPWIAGFFAKLAIIKVQRGDVIGSLNLIRDGREKLEQTIINDRIAFLLDAAELVVQLNQGKMDRVFELFNRIPENDQIKQYKLVMELWSNPKAAIAKLNQMETPTDQLKFHKEGLLASFNQQNPKVCIEHLRNSLKYAEANGYFRSYLLMPEPVRLNMLEIANENPSPYLNRLSKAIREQSQRIIKNESSGEASLTKRELDILRRLDTGLPISKIASSVNISHNTIKTHLKNLYRKLNVDSRSEAVERGKELMLL